MIMIKKILSDVLKLIKCSSLCVDETENLLENMIDEQEQAPDILIPSVVVICVCQEDDEATDLDVALRTPLPEDDSDDDQF